MMGAALRIFAFLTIVTGLAYPLLMTGIAQVGFSKKANGSLIEKDGKLIGSELIAQKFEHPYHFFPRPSAIDYNAMPSGGSNLGPTSQDLKAKVEDRRKAGLEEDLLFASGSGLDPHISPKSAYAQVPRIITALHVPSAQAERVTREVKALVASSIEGRQFRVFGDPRVNVLRINLELDDLARRENLRPERIKENL